MQAASLAGATSSPVCTRRLPAATVEELESFFEAQLTQVGAHGQLPSLVILGNQGGGAGCNRH
jgi:hypothetical protein